MLTDHQAALATPTFDIPPVAERLSLPKSCRSVPLPAFLTRNTRRSEAS